MSEQLATATGLYGLLAEFREPEQVVAAARAARSAGYRRLDGYSPQPVEGLAEAIGHRTSKVPLLVLIGGVVGCLSGFALQYWTMGIAYPINVGGRPLNTWPAWVPVMFELTVLIAAVTAVLGMLGLNGLPMPYHPLFHVRRFEGATRNRFFLCIEARDPLFDREATAAFLERQKPLEVYEVPW
jgi:hypothetical protein